MENQTIRTFTVEEANRLLPAISSTLENIFTMGRRIKELTSDIEDLFSIWGKDLMDSGNSDNSYYLDKMVLRERVLNEINARINEINGLGCVVKDPENGLVDFYHETKGEIVFLCWKYGEEKIDHWHAIEGGFRTRQPLNN